MRIRTLKPEFWTNPDLARLTYFTRLLAIGLLNYADDDGYFWADAAVIRGALFPFEKDAVEVADGLSQLGKIGFTTYHNCRNGRVAGLVVNFQKHQYIDRPSRSKIKEWIDFDEGSLIPRGALAAGTGNREQGTGKGTGKGCGETSGELFGGELEQAPKPEPAKMVPMKTELQLKTEAFFRRRPATPWSKAEQDAWKRALPTVEQTTPEEWETLARWYAIKQAPPPAPQLYRRQNLDTLLNNWANEIAKAQRFLEQPAARDLVSESQEASRRSLQRYLAEKQSTAL